jgi:hypothetical protein
MSKYQDEIGLSIDVTIDHSEQALITKKMLMQNSTGNEKSNGHTVVDTYCYWCGKPATSKEHVPPKCLFPIDKDIREFGLNSTE